MKKTTVLWFLITFASAAYSQGLKAKIDSSLLNLGRNGIKAITLRNTLNLMVDSVKQKDTELASRILSSENEIVDIKYPNYVKNKNLNFSTFEKQVIRAIKTLDLKVPDTQKLDDWRINFVATIPATSGFVSGFKYRVMVRNFTTNTDFTLINQNTTFNLDEINGIKFYSGTSTNGSVSIEYNIGIDWKYLLNLGSNFEYFVNSTSNNLKINIGFWEQETNIEQRLKVVEPVVIANTTNIASNTAKINEIQNALNDYKEQEVNVITGGYVNTLGNIVSISNKSYIVYNATSSDSIKITTTISGAALCLVAYKNADGVLVGTQNIGVNGVFTTYTDFKLTIPTGTSTVWINKENTFPFVLKKKQITKAATQEALNYVFEKVANNEAEITNHRSILSSYVIQGVVYIDGFYYNNAGQAIASSSRRYTVINATNADSIKITTKINGSPIFLAVYRNSLGAIIGTQFQGTDGVSNIYTMQKLNIPTGTASIVLNGMISDPILVHKKQTVTGVVAVETTNALDSRITTNETNISFHKSTLSNYVIKNGINAVQNYYVNSSGGLASSAFRNHKIITATSADSIRVTSKINGSPMFLAVYLNPSNIVIGTQFQGINGVTNEYIKQKLTIPAGTASIVINYMNSDSLIIERKELLTSVVTPDQYNELLSIVKPLSGKTILWLGTSIPEGGLYPERASAKLGATCINRAVGSSMMRIAKYDGSINGLAWQNVCYALCHTIAQKQDLIDNWESYRTILGNSPPLTLSSTEQAKILSCSYENRLLPYLNGTLEMPSLFVIDHGHNDNLASDTDAQFTEQPSNRTDRNTFLGSMNFIVDLILQYNPRARIFFVGHYENARKTRISIAQTNNAEKWDFPFLPLWKYTGFTQERVPNSSNLWSQVPYSTYSAGQDTTQNLTMTRLYMPDDLHPHTDTSFKTQTLLTNIVSEFLRSNF